MIPRCCAQATPAIGIVPLDADDWLPPAAQEAVRRLKETVMADDGIDAIMAPYHWAFNPDGSVSERFDRERFVRRSAGFVWREPVHETLSVPGFRGVVPRWTRVRYTGSDPEGRRIEREVSDFHARVVQHECDHLDGILYPMRIADMRQFGFTDVLFPDLAGVDADE